MATAKLRLDTRPKANGLHNVKIAIYHKDQKKFFGTSEDLSRKDFEQIKDAIAGNLNLRRADKIKVKERIERHLHEAEDICKELSHRFSYYQFNQRFGNSRQKEDALEYLFDLHINAKKEAGKIGTAVSYNNAKQSILALAPSATIRDVTKEFLAHYRKHMESRGRSRTTIGIYMRSLRTIFNAAIRSGLVSDSDYPFKDFTIPSPSGRKMALEAEQVGKLWRYQPKDEAEKRAKDFFFISLLANGMNFKDIVLLRQSNFEGTEIVFEREKVKDQDPKLVRIPLTAELTTLINRNRLHKIAGNSFVFDVLNESDTLEDQNKRLRQFIKTTNKYLKRIAANLELPAISTYTARHTWATVALREGLSVPEISEALGHANIKTTQNYLGGFAASKRAENASKVNSAMGL